MRVAKIENGVVVEVSEINRPIADFPGCSYVEVTESVEKGWLYDGVDFTPDAGQVDRTKQRFNKAILAQLAKMEHDILCKLCESDPAYVALKAQLK